MRCEGHGRESLTAGWNSNSTGRLAGFSRGWLHPHPRPHLPPTSPAMGRGSQPAETAHTHADSSKDRDTQEESILRDSGEGGSGGLWQVNSAGSRVPAGYSVDGPMTIYVRIQRSPWNA